MTRSRLRSLGVARPSDVGDAEALARLARGETSALATLYDRHHLALHRFIAHATNHPHDSEDIVHMTFLTAAKAADSFDGRLSCLPWLLGIAARLVQRRRRTLARWARAAREFAIQVGDARVDAQRDLIARDQLHSVGAALAKLSHSKRIVLVLAEIEGLTCEEIATALGIPIGTVWTRLHHARHELRSAFSRGDGP